MVKGFSEIPKFENLNREVIETWASELRERFKAEIRDNKIAIVTSADARILEVTYKNVYMRVVVGESKDPLRPFSFDRFVSESSQPKTEFYSKSQGSLNYMSEEDVKSELDKLRL